MNEHDFLKRFESAAPTPRKVFRSKLHASFVATAMGGGVGASLLHLRMRRPHTSQIVIASTVASVVIVGSVFAAVGLNRQDPVSPKPIPSPVATATQPVEQPAATAPNPEPAPDTAVIVPPASQVAPPASVPIPPTPTPPPVPVPDPVPQPRTYDVKAWNGQRLEDNSYESDMPTRGADYQTTVTADSINYDWGTSSPDPSIQIHHFFVEVSSTLDLTAGEHTLSMRADDAVRAYINDTLVIDSWDARGEHSYEQQFTATTEPTKLVVNYKEVTGTADLSIAIDPPAQVTETPTN